MSLIAVVLLVAAQATNASPPGPTEEQPPEIHLRQGYGGQVEVSITVSATRTGGRRR